MEIGLAIPTVNGFPREQESREGGWRTRYERNYYICDMAETLGYDFGTTGQHRFIEESVPASSPLTVLAALAARTKRMRLGTNIALLPLQNPIEFAEAAATVDEISDGRLFIGVGIGYRADEFEILGVSFKERISRTEEALEVMRGCWKDQAFFHKGKHFEVNGGNVVPKPVQPGGPPIWMGATSEPGVLRAARLTDGLLTDNSTRVSEMVPQLDRYRAEAREHGRAGAVALNRKVGIGKTREQVEREWLPPIVDVYREYIRLGNTFDDKYFQAKIMSGDDLTLDDIPSDRFIAGTPEDCVASIREIQELSGCEYIVADFGRAAHGEEYERIRDMVELFGEKVLPAFK